MNAARLGSPDTGPPEDEVQAFYDLHPYPPPVDDLDGYRQRWQDDQRRRADFHLHWPGRAYRPEVSVLVAGCGTAQAAKHALREPAAQVVGIDISATSVRHTLALKRKYNLTNLEVHQLPVERTGELGRSFDKVVCTGVLHHLADPDAGLRALREVLKPEGALHLMVYAPFGRAGIYMIQEYCRQLGIGNTPKEIQELASTLTALPRDHPLARLLGESPDFSSKAGLADALLNPRERAYSVLQLFDFLERGGMSFGRWFRQAPYLPQCGSLSATPHAARLAALPPKEQYSALELWRGTMLRHNLVAWRDDRPGGLVQPGFESGWEAYVPLRLPEAITLHPEGAKLPPGAAALLINRSHSATDLILPVVDSELRLVDAIDGKRTIGEIVRRVAGTGSIRLPHIRTQAQGLFERLWWYDQVVFDTSLARAETGLDGTPSQD